MRRLLLSMSMAAIVAAVPATAAAQNGNAQIQAFGGMTMRGITPSSAFGGNIAIPVGSNVQVLVEGGRMSDVISGPLATLIDFSPVDLRVSAYYGRTGVRVLGSSDRVLRPYGEATVGVARLRTSVSGLGDRTDLITNAALGFLGSTQPVFGAGAGVMVQAGPAVVDLGYRFDRFGTGNSVQNVLTGGTLSAHQVRVGIGVRF